MSFNIIHCLFSYLYCAIFWLEYTIHVLPRQRCSCTSIFSSHIFFVFHRPVYFDLLASSEFTFLRTWSQVSGLTESLVPSVLARLESRSTRGTFLRTWSQVSGLTKSLVPSVLARLGSFSTEDELAKKEPGPKRPRLKARTYALPRERLWFFLLIDS